ncbi:hypothetical protein D3C75_369050 [compost metagenome]
MKCWRMLARVLLSAAALVFTSALSHTCVKQRRRRMVCLGAWWCLAFRLCRRRFWKPWPCSRATARCCCVSTTLVAIIGAISSLIRSCWGIPIAVSRTEVLLWRRANMASHCSPLGVSKVATTSICSTTMTSRRVIDTLLRGLTAGVSICSMTSNHQAC